MFWKSKKKAKETQSGFVSAEIKLVVVENLPTDGIEIRVNHDYFNKYFTAWNSESPPKMEITIMPVL